MTNFILYENRALTLVVVPADRAAVYSLETTAQLCGVHPELLRYYCRHGLLGDARAQGEATFDDDALFELRRIEDYRRYHGVNRQALPLLWGLKREVERLQAEVRFLRGP